MAQDSSPDRPRPLREIVADVKGWVERLGSVWVSGQVIAINRKTGAIHFLTLRDSSAEVSVSLTCPTAVLDAAGPLREGMAVVALIKPAVWLGSGRLSFDCRDLRPVGQGRLLAQLEQLKRRLQAEGLFDPARKRPLPFLPRRIGLITAQGSAAERDVLVNVARRWPAARLEVRHALMQGPSCAQQVGHWLRQLDSDPSVDLIVIARGGGSVEDLLPFSDETLVRLVAAAGTPVVSAIGHESDTPVLDLVADLRASTPTDAAKRIVPEATAELAGLTGARRRLRLALTSRIEAAAAELAGLRSRPVLRHPLGGYASLAIQLDQNRARLRQAIAHHTDQASLDVKHLLTQVRALSPQATLGRGYAILVGADGRAIARTGQVRPGQAVTAHLSDGTLDLVAATRSSEGEP
ncbi:MAG: exodeoxyribonuclease VII large subunit [Propionibacteriaceae bacterium]|jgi:exodeoxyribonuclease VII large subunit|nr:exodeoxyribonuclease VII large subunit [Propionibacteriaceae bacterium]